MCRWILRFKAEPKRWIRVTAPLRAPEATVKPDWRIMNVEMARCTTASTAVSAWGSAARRKRRGNGKVSYSYRHPACNTLVNCV